MVSIKEIMKENIAVNCKTKGEAIEFFELAKQEGIEYDGDHYWDTYKDETHYELRESLEVLWWSWSVRNRLFYHRLQRIRL